MKYQRRLTLFSSTGTLGFIGVENVCSLLWKENEKRVVRVFDDRYAKLAQAIRAPKPPVSYMLQQSSLTAEKFQMTIHAFY